MDRELQAGGGEEGRKEGAVVVGVWTQVEETASARERIETYRGEFPHAAYGYGLRCAWETKKSDPGV